MEPDPEDINPEAEEVPHGGEHAFDEEDKADSDDELFSLKDIMPIGMEGSRPRQLLNPSSNFVVRRGQELVGKMVAV